MHVKIIVFMVFCMDQHMVFLPILKTIWNIHLYVHHSANFALDDSIQQSGVFSDVCDPNMCSTMEKMVSRMECKWKLNGRWNGSWDVIRNGFHYE